MVKTQKVLRPQGRSGTVPVMFQPDQLPGNVWGLAEKCLVPQVIIARSFMGTVHLVLVQPLSEY